MFLSFVSQPSSTSYVRLSPYAAGVSAAAASAVTVTSTVVVAADPSATVNTGELTPLGIGMMMMFPAFPVVGAVVSSAFNDR